MASAGRSKNSIWILKAFNLNGKLIEISPTDVIIGNQGQTNQIDEGFSQKSYEIDTFQISIGNLNWTLIYKILTGYKQILILKGDFIEKTPK